MGDTATNTEVSKSPKKSFFKGVKAEYKKISWPDKESLVKQTVAVVLSTAVLCVLTALIDFLIRSGLNFLI